MLRGKTGAARLAFESGAPIQPIAVHVTEKHSRIVHGKFYGRPTVGSWQIGGSARVVIGEAWRPFEGATKVAPKDLRQVTDEVMARIRRLLDQARAATG
jgi:1-acyl-sn-glycerol-3-phosphate acyltransferase